MSLEKRLAASIVQYLGEQLRSDDLTGEDKEGLEGKTLCFTNINFPLNLLSVCLIITFVFISFNL